MSNGFDMEAAAKAACESFDREHGSEEDQKSDMHQMPDDPIYDADGYAVCSCGCGAKTHKDVLEKRKKEMAESLVGATITAEIKGVPGEDQAGVVVSLPETKEQAYLLILGIINTMSMAGNESFGDVMSEVSRLNSMGAMSKGEKYTQ